MATGENSTSTTGEKTKSRSIAAFASIASAHPLGNFTINHYARIEILAEQLSLVNNRRFRGQATSRRDLFEELERDALQPLPTTHYEFADWKPARVNIDYHVEVDRHYYSVPHALIPAAVEICWLMIACANVSNRMLSHGLARRRAMAS